MIANPNITHTQFESPSLTVRPGETRVNHPDSDPPCAPNYAVLRIGSVPVPNPRERPADADPGGLAVNVSGIGHRAPRRRQFKELAGRLPLEPISERTLERSATPRWLIDQGVQVDYAAGARAGPSLFGDPTSRLVTPDLLSGLMAGGEIRRDGGVVVADACAGDVQHGAVAWRCDPQLALSKVDTIVRARVPVSV